MTEATTTAPENSQTTETTPETPATEATTETAPPAKKTLEESLADLDESTRKFVLGEVSTARTEAKNLRDRLKQAEPKITEYDRLVAASKTAEERAQEAAQEATARATTALQRVAKAEIKAALTGVVDDPSSVIEDLDLSRFVDSDGDVDTSAVETLRAKYARLNAAAGAPRPPRPDASQASGANGKTTASPADEFASFINQQLRPK